MDEIIETIKDKVTGYFADIPEMEGEVVSKLLVEFVIEQYKHIRRFPSTFTDEQIQNDILNNTSIIAMAVVDLKAKEGAEGETSHSENSTSRSYENAYISSSIFKGVLPYSSIV